MAICLWIIVQQAWVLQVLVLYLLFGFKCARDSYWIYIKISPFFFPKKKKKKTYICFDFHLKQKRRNLICNSWDFFFWLNNSWDFGNTWKGMMLFKSNVFFVKYLHKILWLWTIWCLLQIMHQCHHRKLLQIKVFLPWYVYFFLMNMHGLCIINY